MVQICLYMDVRRYDTHFASESKFLSVPRLSLRIIMATRKFIRLNQNFLRWNISNFCTMKFQPIFNFTHFTMQYQTQDQELSRTPTHTHWRSKTFSFFRFSCICSYIIEKMLYSFRWGEMKQCWRVVKLARFGLRTERKFSNNLMSDS